MHINIGNIGMKEKMDTQRFLEIREYCDSAGSWGLWQYSAKCAF